MADTIDVKVCPECGHDRSSWSYSGGLKRICHRCNTTWNPKDIHNKQIDAERERLEMNTHRE